MATKHEFLLPDELGWECNDEISAKIDEWMANAIHHLVKAGDGRKELWEVAKAQLTDDIYAIIKKYQEEQ